LTGTALIWPNRQRNGNASFFFPLWFSLRACYCVNVFISLFSFVSDWLYDCWPVGAPNCGIDTRRKPRKNICRRLLIGPTFLSGICKSVFTRGPGLKIYCWLTNSNQYRSYTHMWFQLNLNKFDTLRIKLSDRINYLRNKNRTQF